MSPPAGESWTGSVEAPPRTPSARHGPSRASLGTTLNPGHCPAPSPWKTHRQMQGPPAWSPPATRTFLSLEARPRGTRSGLQGRVWHLGQGRAAHRVSTRPPNLIRYSTSWLGARAWKGTVPPPAPRSEHARLPPPQLLQPSPAGTQPPPTPLPTPPHRGLSGVSCAPS